ncbi:glycosyltransferase family 4 protein [Zobellella denitrificans]|uniref:glycosyltransferase family 4 protein n=1 Tax=Zobellella denitrificans TaxID=347534 RepID=UPI000BBEB201|nr:glycosyltransferase family 4 protein [Zobellella denitrificans]
MVATSVIFLGFTIPDEDIQTICENDQQMPIQTHKFAWNFVDCLSKAGIDVELVSSEPVSNYPRYKKIFFKGGLNDCKGYKLQKLFFINVLVFKHITRLFSSIISLFSINKKKSFDIVFVHGVHSPYLVSSWLFCFLLKKKFVAILTDPPGVIIGSDGAFSRFLKKIDVLIVRTLLSKADGVIAVAPGLIENLSLDTESIILEGFVEPSKALLSKSFSNKQETVNFLYAGGLFKEYGINEFVDAFSSCKLDNITLTVLGKGSSAEYIQGVSDKDPRIKYLGFKSGDELDGLFSGADVFVNPRMKDGYIENLSFPSKLLEYLSFGKPVLTTKLNSIPSDYDEFFIYFDSDNVTDFREKIEAVASMSKSELFTLGDKGKKFSLSQKTPQGHAHKVAMFINKILGKK